jgi:hypothetical protein
VLQKQKKKNKDSILAQVNRIYSLLASKKKQKKAWNPEIVLAGAQVTSFLY